MRMKAAFVFLAMVFSGVSAFAGVGIIWTTLWGAYDHTAIDLTGEDHALLDGYCAIWQLVYAGPNHVADPPWVSVGGPGIADDYVSGDDVVWAQRVIPLGGGSGNDAPYNTVWNNWMQNEGGSVVYTDLTWSTEGYVFQRVFEGIPVLTSWYYQSPLLAINTGYSGGGQGAQEFYPDTIYAGFQPGPPFPLEPPPNRLTINPASTNFTSSPWNGRTITVAANVAWTAVSNAAWIAVTGGAGTTNGTVTFSVTSNAGTTSRAGGVIVAGGGITRTCTVTQAGVSRPTVLADSSFGVASNRFGFNVNWTSGQVVVVDASTNLTQTNWMPLATGTLAGAPYYFFDPSWTNHVGRFYRIRSP